MKILIMCEGPNELAVINMLLDNGCLRFTRDDLLDMRAFHARQLNSTQLKPAFNAYHGDIMIYRVGDKMNEALKIPKDFSNPIIGQEKYCTKPELEMLFIIAENLTSSYEKTKSKVPPKLFCKQNVKLNKKAYDNSTKFYFDYFSSNLDLLISTIIEYKRTHGKHKSDEKYFADLLK